METFKRNLRRLGFILLIVLASVGVGLSGGVPIKSSGRSKQESVIEVELVEEKEDGLEEKENEEKS